MFHEFQNCQNESDFAILGADWNISLSQELDTFGYTFENNKNAKKMSIRAYGKPGPSGYIQIFIS